MTDIIHGIVHAVNQQSWWSVPSDLDPRREPETRLRTSVIPEMSRIKQDREVRKRPLTVGSVYQSVNALLRVAHRRGEVPAGREADDADLAWIDAVGRGSMSQQPDRTLRVLQRELHLRCMLDAVVTPYLRNSVLQHDARYAALRNPVADFRSFQIHGDGLVSAARQHQHRSAGVSPLGRVDRHRRTRHITRPVPGSSGNHPRAVADLFGFAGVGF